MDQETKDSYTLLKNAGLEPRIEPIALFKADVPQRLGLKKTDSGFIGMDVTYIKNYADLYISNTDPYEQDKDGVFSYLYGLNHKREAKTLYDCEDRAFWAMAHARHKFPGLPICVVSGIAMEGGPGMTGVPHALIGLWWHKKNGGVDEYVCSFFDPMLGRFVKGIKDIKAVIGFPIDSERWHPIPESIGSLDGKVIAFDEYRLIYPLDGENGISDYLINKRYEEPGNCKDPHDSIYDKKSPNFRNRWRDYDKALWEFVHLRHDYAGSPIGVAIGERGGIPAYEIIIWYIDESGRISHKYWSPVSDGFQSTDMDTLKTIFI